MVMTLAFQNGRSAAAAERPLDASNPYRKPSKAYFDFRRGYQTAPVYGVAPIVRARREDACSISIDDAVRILSTPAQWGRPTRAVAWFHETSDRLYAVCAEWDIAHLGTTRRVEKRWCADGKWRQTASWIDHEKAAA